jgi:hypothetical protein
MPTGNYTSNEAYERRQDKKFTLIGTAARRFMGASNRLVDAGIRLRQTTAGTPSGQRAQAKYNAASAEYDKRYAVLDKIIDDLG